MKTKVFVIPSTHWDREWVLPFEQFRYKLVRLTDRLIDILENNKEYKYFHFDGQTTVIDDYLEIRPENKERIVSLMKEGRLLVGPFRNMLDCLLPSGEAITRNMQIGLNDCKKWGAKSHKLGYTCDTFGHNAQMPQIYANFDIEHCLMLRGREGFEDDKFVWVGADGSETTVYRVHPDYNYADFYLVARWPLQCRNSTNLEEMANAVKEHLDGYKQYIKGGCHCMIDGYDNLEPDERLPEYIDYLNKTLTDYEFVISNFIDYNKECDKSKDSYNKHFGIIYDPEKDGTGCFLMKNVASSMVNMKQDNMYAEDFLSFVAEPLDAFTQTCLKREYSDFYPMQRSSFFDYAWGKIVNNQPHDTLGGTCCGATHLDNINDYKRARENIEVALKDTMQELALNVKVEGKGKDGAFVVYNPSQVDIDGFTTLQLKFKSGENIKETFFYQGNDLIEHTVLDKSTAIEQIADFKKMADYVKYDTYTVAMNLKIPAYSYSVITYDYPKFERNFEGGEWVFARYDKVRRDYSSMMVGVNTFDNGVLTVGINQNGSIWVKDKQTGKEYDGLFVFEDDSENGEGWNHRNCLFDEKFSSFCSLAQVSVLCDNQNVAKFKVVHTFRLPKNCSEVQRSDETTDFTVNTTYTLLRNSKRIDAKIEIDNNVKNHRLRVVFPTQLKTESFHTAMPYDMQKWQIERGDHTYDTEPFSPTVVGQGLLNIADDTSSFSVYTKGLYEFEVADREDRAVSVTLIRSIPKETFFLESDVAQLQGKHTFEIALDFEKCDNSMLIKKSRLFRTGVVSEIVRTTNGSLGFEKIIGISGNAVLSSFRAKDVITGKPTVRIYDVDGGAKGVIEFSKPIKSAYKVKLNGERVEKLEVCGNKLPYSLKNKEILTVEVEFEVVK